MLQGGEERHGGSACLGDGRHQALAAQGPAMRAGNVCLGPGLVDKDQARRVNAMLVALPALALAGDVCPVLLGGAQAFL